jgi:thiamine-phosphate pyrophosphorylase
MIRYLITDRARAGSLAAQREAIARLLAAGSLDYVQIREKDLEVRTLLDFARAVLALPNPAGARILVNSRADVAAAAGPDVGLHLPGDSVAPGRFRTVVPRPRVISVACHSVDEVRQAEAEGADLALFSPIFPMEGKAPAQGLDRLREAAGAVRIPVLALGGVDRQDRVAACLEAGAAGVAGIRLFS